MTRLLQRAAVAASIGAVAGALLLVLAANWHPALTFEMDRDLPQRIASGFYPVEISGEDSFAWTSDRAQLTILGFDRRLAWRCTARIRGSRPGDLPQPQVTMTVDGQPLASRTATNDYETLEAIAPPRGTRGLKIALLSSVTFVPGPSDPRHLGVRVDRLSCAPADSGFVIPPSSALSAAAASGAMFGALFGGIGSTTLAAVAGAIVVAALQAFPLSTGVAPYTTYSDRMMALAFWIALAAAIGVAVVRWRAQTELSPFGRTAVGFSAGVLFLKLLAVLHPGKALVDALFHAHRLEYVLAGNYFFTQLMPGGVQFPYAIALYVFSAPLAPLTRDHVLLLRIVVSACEAAAGLCLYWAVARTWRTGGIALGALVLYHLLPVSYWVVGNANMTNAFGQSAAVVTMSALIVWALDLRRWPETIALALLASIAFLSHVSTFALLAMTMTGAAVLFGWKGGPARGVLAAVLLAAVLSIAIYYGRAEFVDAYRSATSARAAESIDAPGPNDAARTTPSAPARILEALRQTEQSIGWPMLICAAIGAWRMRAERRGGRLTVVIGAWLLAFAVSFVFAVAAPARVGQQRYALEFIARAVYAASPALFVLGATGLVWMFGRRRALRAAAVLLAAAAVFEAGRQWASWIQ